jgi:HEAT repeat protein
LPVSIDKRADPFRFKSVKKSIPEKFIETRCLRVSRTNRPTIGAYRAFSDRLRNRIRMALWRTICVVCAALWTGIGLCPSLSEAQSGSFNRVVNLGRPGRPVRIRIETDSSGVRLEAGRSVTELPLADVAGVDLDVVELSGNGRVAIVIVRGKAGEVASLVTRPRGGKPAILWSGRLDPAGDPGERSGSVIEVADRTGDGVDDIVVGRYLESTRICGQKRSVIFPMAVDPESLTLRPVLLDRVAGASADREDATRATRESPGPTAPPLLKTLRFVAASSTAGSRDPATASPPFALSDGDPSTVWIEGRGRGGRGEFATANWEAYRWPIRAIALTVSPPERDAARRFARPRWIWIVGDGGERLRVELPEDPLDFPGERLWITPPRPLRWKCLSLVLGDPYGPIGKNTAAAAISEVEVYTDLDFGGGIARLVKELAGDGPDATDAARLLGIIGTRAIPAVARAWSKMSEVGRRRSIRVFAASAREDRVAVEALVRASADPAAEVRKSALEALGRSGEAGFEALSRLAAEAGEVGDRAALAIAHTHSARSVGVLLRVITADEKTSRPGLRRALRHAVARGGDEALESVARWSREEQPVGPMASVILALSDVDQAHQQALALFPRAASRSGRFEDRWRLIVAARGLPADSRVDGFLASVVGREERWMARSAALDALAARGAASTGQLARKALQDPYPRVRMAALAFLADGPETFRLRSRYAQSDKWPMVRAAAVESLSHVPKATGVVVDRLQDGSKIVRAAAIRVLRIRRDRAAWNSVEDRLRDDDEWPAVISEGISFVRELCIREGAEALSAVVDRGLKPRPWLPDVDLAARALEALSLLGGPTAESVFRAASSPAAPAIIRENAERAARRTEHCSPVPED